MPFHTAKAASAALGSIFAMSELLRHVCHLESATNIVSRRPGTCRYWYYNIRNILYKLVLNFYLKFSSSKSPFCSGLAHPANHAVWHRPGPRLSELAFFSLKKPKVYTFFLKFVCWQLFTKTCWQTLWILVVVVVALQAFWNVRIRAQKGQKVTGRCFFSYICSCEVCVIVFIYDHSPLI